MHTESCHEKKLQEAGIHWGPWPPYGSSSTGSRGWAEPEQSETCLSRTPWGHLEILSRFWGGHTRNSKSFGIMASLPLAWPFLSYAKGVFNVNTLSKANLAWVFFSLWTLAGYTLYYRAFILLKQEQEIATPFTKITPCLKEKGALNGPLLSILAQELINSDINSSLG